MNAKAAKALRKLAGTGHPYQQAKRAWGRRPRDRRSLLEVKAFTLDANVRLARS